MASSPQDGRDMPHLAGSIEEILDRAAALTRQAQYDKSESILAQLTEANPKHSEAWSLRGVNALNANAAPLAVHCFYQAVRFEPRDSARIRARYAANLGRALGAEKRWHEATKAWSRAIVSMPDVPAYQLGFATSLLYDNQPDDAFLLAERALAADAPPPKAIFAFARALAALGRTKAAVNAYEAGLAHDPENLDALHRLGALAFRLGDHEKAALRFRQFLERDPNRAAVWNSFSAAARALGRNEEALSAAGRALTLRPNYPEAENNLGLALCALKRPQEAIPHFCAALDNGGKEPDILNNLGVAQHACGDLTTAEETLRQSHALDPSAAAPLRNLGNVLRAAERLDEASQCYRQALGLNPLDFAAYGNLGLVMLNMNRPEDAVTVYEKALALNPDHAGLRKSLGIAELTLGRFAAGWSHYEARLLEDNKHPNLPRWDGGTSAAAVLVEAEQGFGDTLQFCRYLPLVAARTGRTVFRCQPALAQLMRSLDADVTVESDNAPAGEADFHIPLLSLPSLFETTLETVPAETPYLHADPEKVESWRRRLASESDAGKPRVGLVWSGNPNRQDDNMRSCPPQHLRSLTDIDTADFFSLQKEGVPAVLAPLPDLSADLGDFSDTAAAIAALDLVISVDTATAHLAGSLGKEVWVMLGYAADWRYLLNRDDSPWYPTMRLFRQSAPGNWAGLVETVTEALQQWRIPGRKE